MNVKILIIRFSSFGDIVQSLACAPALAKQGQVDFLTKKSFSQLPALCTSINRVHAFDTSQGLIGLLKLAWSLRAQNYSVVYDAHENPRSKIVRFILSSFTQSRVVVRSKSRWRRFLFFKLKKYGALPMPFKGMVSYCRPMGVDPTQQEWQFDQQLASKRFQELAQYTNKIVLVPSAAWEMKRWPIEHWREVIKQLSQESVVLGGNKDDFCHDLAELSNKSLSLAGQLSLVESAYIVSKAKAVISADTGLLHVADLLNVPAIALLGPTAFGYPTFENACEIGVELSCRPCSKDGRGGCTQAVWRRCMVEISPREVLNKLQYMTSCS